MEKEVHLGFLGPGQDQSGQELTVALLTHDEEAVVGVGHRQAAGCHGVEVVRAARIAQFQHQVGPLVATPFVAQFGRHLQHLGLFATDLVATHPPQLGTHHCKIAEKSFTLFDKYKPTRSTTRLWDNLPKSARQKLSKMFS